MLNRDAILQFRNKGYLLLPDKVEDVLVDKALSYVMNYVRNRSDDSCKLDSNERPVKIYNLWDRDPVFQSIYTHQYILDSLKQILGHNIEFRLDRHNTASIMHKGSGQKRHHRDVVNFTRTMVAALIALQDTTIENGCTEIIPGSHLELPVYANGFHHGHYGVWLDEFPEFNNLAETAIKVPMKKGQVLLFDAVLFHTPGDNNTDTPRSVMTASYHAMDELRPLNTYENGESVLVVGKRFYGGNKRTIC